MRTLIALITIGFVAAAICFGAAQENPSNSSTGGNKSAVSKARPPADTAKSTSAKPTTDAAGQQAGDRSAVANAVEDKNDELTNKHADDEEAILKTGISFVVAYADHDAKRVADHFAPEAEFIDEEGQAFQGRDEIEASLSKVFKEHPRASLEIDVDSLTFLSPLLAIESGTTTCRQDEKAPAHTTSYTAIHAKSDGKWLVASVREQELHGQRVHSARLQQLDWLVGNWVDEAEDSIVRFNCRMTDADHYLVREFSVSVAGRTVISGSQRTGWDPLSDKLRSWTFDSEGGYFDGAWHRDGEKWVLTSVGITADGQSAAGTAIFTPVDANTIIWQAVDRVIDGVRVDDSEEFTLVRTGPQPQTSDETAAK